MTDISVGMPHIAPPPAARSWRRTTRPRWRGWNGCPGERRSATPAHAENGASVTFLSIGALALLALSLPLVLLHLRRRPPVTGRRSCSANR